ncbi:hypothetical protein TcCL_ESM07677 [Trypanosoma cruzi]|nr:hypothetical protein TcCL_ESM07677 [Trypanosoma cruzi]
MAQKHIQCAAGARGQARQTVADGEFKRIRREGPIHIPVTREHASTKCADSTGDHSTCDSDSVTDERIFLLPRQSTNAVPTLPQHGRSQRAGTWCLHASRQHRPGLERAPSSFARTTSSMEKLRQRALLRSSRLRTSSAGGSLPPGEAVCAFHAAAATHSACSTLTVQVHQWLSRLPRGMVHLRISNHVVTVARGVPHAEVEAFQSALRRTTTACFRRGSMPAGRGMPSSVPAVYNGRWWSDSMQRLDVKWETRSTRCAVTSGNETMRPLIRVACAGSSDSSHSMPLGVAARSSPAVVDVSDRHAAHGVNSGSPQ